jgi:cytochrome P450
VATVSTSAEATVASIEEAERALVDPAAYADGRFEQACALLRRESPVHRVEVEGFRPFYALTKYEDIHSVERQGDLFHAGPRYRLFREADDPKPGEGVTTLVRIDPPEHTVYRNLVKDWFHPRSLRSREARVQALADATVDSMATLGEPYDFVTEVSMQLPLSIICDMLGVPQEDRQLILSMTQTAFGAEDPEYRARLAALAETSTPPDFVTYVMDLMSQRRDNPTDDITTLLATGELNGKPLELMDQLAFFGILATAGHDTTSSVMAGGLLALIQHPDQLELLRRDPTLAEPAVEEMIRWVSPVKHFIRTAMADTEIRGQHLVEGEAVLLLYPSANRDEEVFDGPDRFDVTRDPNRHLAFGHGAHFCLGAQLARLETRALFRTLAPRLESIELTGDPELIQTLFVGGLKHLPIQALVR